MDILLIAGLYKDYLMNSENPPNERLLHVLMNSSTASFSQTIKRTVYNKKMGM